MKIDIVTLIVSVLPAVISYFTATKNATNKIDAIKEETERDIMSIRADTQREIEKIKADTEREIEKINAETESQIKIMEAQSKAKSSEKMNDILNDKLGKLFSKMIEEPKSMKKLLEISAKGDPTDKDYFDLISTALNGKDE